MKLEDILAQPYILADGAMGTYLISKGYTSAQQLDMINITHPEIVAQIHGEYIDAGASLIETNTFSANCFKLAAHGHQDQVYLVNKMGGIIARRAAEKKGDKGKEIMVGGSIGPMGKMLAPIGKITEEEATESFRQQVHGLIAGGVDLLIIETFTDLQELGLAIKVVKEITDLPIAAHKTFIESGNKIIGELPAQVANFLREKGADIIGANCTVGPQRMLQIIGSIRQAVGEMPLSAFPNAGLPRRTREMITYTTTPEYMAEYAIKLVQAGVKIIGGCCGTTPKHIYAIKQALASLAEIRVISPEKIKAAIKEQEALGD